MLGSISCSICENQNWFYRQLVEILVAIVNLAESFELVNTDLELV